MIAFISSGGSWLHLLRYSLRAKLYNYYIIPDVDYFNRTNFRVSVKLGKERSCHIIYIYFFALLPLGRYSRFALACSPARSRKLRHFCFAKLQKRAAEQRVTFSRFPSLEKRKASKSMQTRLPCKHLVNFKHRSFLTLPFPLGTCLQREAFIQRRLVNAQIKFLFETNQVSE